MNRKHFLKSLAMIPMAAFLGVKTIPVADDKNAPVNLETRSIFIPSPCPANIRAAVQSLASRAIVPGFSDKRFRGWIAYQSGPRNFGIYDYLENPSRLRYQIGDEFETPGTGVIFRVVPTDVMTHGAFIFSKHSPFASKETT